MAPQCFERSRRLVRGEDANESRHDITGHLGNAQALVKPSAGGSLSTVGPWECSDLDMGNTTVTAITDAALSEEI